MKAYKIQLQLSRKLLRARKEGVSRTCLGKRFRSRLSKSNR